ncbi:hypothetical protein [Stenotrophomonas sp. YAU14D1_LEIMI4_1]|uniref:hypothetical protein n=1 Tax=Stenotrophomonas sp. YAU14D1_LEIMI4_1 TaxID=2072407 RepID=UPI000D53CD4F|nr:hypothetical protein [Stenotrophomonas sp. YAU14D1_LEIMI4_1]AWH25453.1 hypothetical protein C1932_10320 [Stenotrophomonas sp. YAU14D1_LEIMI4_1]
MKAITMARTAVLLLAVAAAGCSTFARPPSPNLRLVTLVPAETRVLLTAAASGTIEPIGECVYFVSASGHRSLALWPDYFELARQGGVPIGVRSTSSNTVVAFGQTHTFGGGELSPMPQMLTRPLPAGCRGPAMMLYFH